MHQLLLDQATNTLVPAEHVRVTAALFHSSCTGYAWWACLCVEQTQFLVRTLALAVPASRDCACLTALENECRLTADDASQCESDQRRTGGLPPVDLVDLVDVAGSVMLNACRLVCTCGRVEGVCTWGDAGRSCPVVPCARKAATTPGTHLAVRAEGTHTGEGPRGQDLEDMDGLTPHL